MTLVHHSSTPYINILIVLFLNYSEMLLIQMGDKLKENPT